MSKLIQIIGVLVIAMLPPALISYGMGGCTRNKSGGDGSGTLGFKFVNEQPQSGITFRHQPTDDSAKNYKSNHYDHGMGVLVADVNNDGLLDVYFLNQIGPNALYKNLGDGKFEDVTSVSGTGVGDRVSTGGSFVDVDNDGDQDLFVATVRGGLTRSGIIDNF